MCIYQRTYLYVKPIYAYVIICMHHVYVCKCMKLLQFATPTWGTTKKCLNMSKPKNISLACAMLKRIAGRYGHEPTMISGSK